MTSTKLSVIISNVVNRPVRALITVLAISLEVLMILLVIGISHGIIQDNADRQEGLSADIIIQPANAPPIFFTTGSATLPDTVSQDLLGISSVQGVTPILFHAQMRGSWLTYYGIDFLSFTEVAGQLNFVEGQTFSSATAKEVIIDDLHAKSQNLGIGEFIELKGERFEVVGIFRNGIGGRVYLPIQSLQLLMDRIGKASTFLVKVNNPEQINKTIGQITGSIENIRVTAMDDWVTLLRNERPKAYQAFLNAVIGVAIAVGSFACFLSVYTTITQRTREIGIFKSLGASKTYIVNLVLVEVLILCIIGLISGFILTFLGQLIIQSLYPTQHLVISVTWIYRTILLVLLSGSLGVFYPAIQATRKDPVQALAHD